MIITLLEGASGEGKSTFAALITGQRQPYGGLLLLQGLDKQTWGMTQWRHSIAVVPQFHENYVMGDSFLFNLLMGRCWPPQQEDWILAQEICQELELEPLLTRMPAGMLQMVGEIGWQLSHGERSRLYIARALLQRTEFVVLDESLAGIDPETSQKVLNCILNRAKTLLLIAHR